jgi:CRP/FNR family transcriptional regulator
VTAEDIRDDASHNAVQRAIAASRLADLSPSLRERVLVGAFPIELPAGGTIYRDDDEPRCALVVTGLVRVILSALNGRTLTIRYARAGELLGVPTIVGGPAPVSAELVTDSRLLALNARALAHLGQTEPAVGWMLATEATHRLYDTIDAVADRAFGSLRQRTARHLLDLAPRQRDGRLNAPVTQQELAEMVGATRPRVSEHLQRLRRQKVLGPGSGELEILRRDALERMAG